MKTIIKILVFTFLISTLVSGNTIPFYSYSADERLGSSGTGIGDFNGDGYDDFISGSIQYRGSFDGVAYIYFGSSTVSSATIPSIKIEGSGERSFGSSVSGNFDFNGDGFKDVIVGASGYHDGKKGKAYIFFGRCDYPPVLDANDADVIIKSEDRVECFGWDVSRGGDVNGDCIDDVIISAPFADGGKGNVYIFHGQKNHPSSSINIPSTDADLIIQGTINDGLLGYSISDLGDISGDNISDIIVGVPVYFEPTGFVNIYYGGQSMDNIADKVFTGPGTGTLGNGSDFGIDVAGLGDVNGNGSRDFIITDWRYPDLANGSAYVYDGLTVPAVNAFTTDLLFDITGELTSNLDGRFGNSCAGIGDNNGDGLNDFIIGNLNFDDVSTPYFGGRVYRFFGSATPQVINPPSGSQILFSGASEYDRVGSNVAEAGDVNGDGRNDLLFGAFGFHSGASITGASFIELSTSPNTSFTTLYLKAFVQGYYSIPNHSQIPTMVKVCLYDNSCKLIDEKNVLLASNGDAIDANNIPTLTPGIKFNNLPPIITKEYYVVIKGLCNNIITTWSSFKINMTRGGTYGSAATPYNFTDASSKAYGDNQIEVEPGVFAIYNGDVDGDCTVSGTDLLQVDNDAFNYVTGGCCLKTDLDGDGTVSANDLCIIENNANNYVSSMSPCDCPCQ